MKLHVAIESGGDEHIVLLGYTREHVERQMFDRFVVGEREAWTDGAVADTHDEQLVDAYIAEGNWHAALTHWLATVGSWAGYILDFHEVPLPPVECL